MKENQFKKRMDMVLYQADEGDVSVEAYHFRGISGQFQRTVFIDDAVRNLDGATALGITPILIAANPDSDVETNYTKISDLRELIL